MTKVYIVDTTHGLLPAVRALCHNIEKAGEPILKSSKNVYIKVNGINFQKHTYTSPDVLKALIEYLKEIGAKNVFVMENSTQANITRAVFAINGFEKVCEETGAKPIYLDEEKTRKFSFKGKSVAEDPKGYNLMTFRLPETVVRLMKTRETVTYLNVPKLKMHSMTKVTLGIKNQWGFLHQEDRGKDHNYNLHVKLVDVYEYIKPDITIIDGIEGTIHGHYPPTAWEDLLVKPFNILIGGRDTVAVDVVGARVFGLTRDEVPHLHIAHERGLGEGDLNKIEVIGKNLDEYKEKYDWNLLQKFPKDVKIVKGKSLLCKEGCENNPLSLLQILAYDHADKFKGGWFIVMGKGHDKDLVKKLKAEGYTKGLVAGYCAIEEVGETLRKEFGKKKVFFSHDCNDLAQTVTAESKLSGVPVLDLVPASLLKTVKYLAQARLHGSKALVPSLF